MTDVSFAYYLQANYNPISGEMVDIHNEAREPRRGAVSSHNERHTCLIMQVKWPNRCQSANEHRDGVAETGNGDAATAER